MILEEVSNASFFISWLKSLSKWQKKIKQRVINVYLRKNISKLLNFFINSVFIRKVCFIIERTKTSFKNSFVGRLTDMEREYNGVNLEDSRFIYWSLQLYSKFSTKLNSYLKASRLKAFLRVRELRKEMHHTVKIGGIVLLIATITDIVLSIFLQKKIDLFSWLLSLLSLSVALASIFCLADWPFVRDNSFFIKLFVWRKANR